MANDIVNINVSETTETVAITVNPNLTTVNINRQVPVGVNAQDLQSVTDIGATTDNTIIVSVAGASPAIAAYSITGNGVYGQSSGIGVFGYTYGDKAVYGYAESSTGIGVSGYAEDGVGGEFETDSNTANIVNFKKGGVLKASVGNGGDITANSFVKSGGTASQILAANGSVITAGTNITISGGTISSTGGGGGGATNLSPSQTATNFTINSDTGTDATIPLGNGTLAGATLNDYTTAEKNKLAGITGDQNLQSVTNLGNAIVLPSNKNRGIDITIADLQSQYSNGIRVTLNSQTGTYSNNDAFVAVMNGQNPNTLPNFVGGFYALATGGDNYSFVSEHNTGTVSSSHYIATNATGITSDFAAFKTNNVNVFKVDYLGNTTAAKFIKEGGFDYQFLKADGSVDNNIYLTSADLPSTLDLYATTTASDISGYTVLVRNIADTRYNTTAVDVSTGVITSVGQLVGSLVTDANIISGNPGVFDFKTIGNISRTNGTGQAEFFFRIYKRNLAGTETLIAESDYTLPVTNGGYVEFSATALWNDGIFLDTDRVVLKYYANRLTSPVGSDPTYQFQFGGTSPVRSSAAIPTSVMPNIYLRDLADVENVDALNNEILYWNDPASLWEHSLAENLVPLATATQKGLVSTTTQTFAGDKTFTGTITSGTVTASSVDDYGVSAVSTNSDGISAESNNGNGIVGVSTNAVGGVFMTTNGANIAEFKTNFVEKAKIDSAGIITGTGLNASGQTINTIASFDGSKNVVSLPTATYPSLTELAYAKGVTSGIQTQLNGKQDTLSSTVNIKSINGNSILGSGDLTIGGGSSSQSAFTILANNTNASAVPTEQVYKNIAEQTYGLSPSWSGTAPTNIVANTYQWSQVGGLVTVRVNLIYSTAGNITQAIIPLPTDMPNPLSPTGFTAALDILYYGTGMFNTSTSAVATTSRVNFLRRNAANTGFDFVITHNASIAARVVTLTLQYFT